MDVTVERNVGRAMMVLAAAVGILTACAVATAAALKGSRFERLGVAPEELSAACDLVWKSKPIELSTSTPEDRRFFQTLTSFWFRGPLKTDLLDGGLSNVYSTADEDSAVVVLSVLFKEPEVANKSAKALRALYHPSAPHSFQAYNRLLVIFSKAEAISDDCFRLVQSSIGRRAAESDFGSRQP